MLFSGALILVGAVAMTKFQRVYEAAVFKTLGANTRTIARMLLLEYGVLGLLAGPRRLARRRRPDLGRQPLRARDSVAHLRRRARRRRRADGGARRGHRRAVEPRRAPEQAARDAASGVVHDHAQTRPSKPLRSWLCERACSLDDLRPPRHDRPDRGPRRPHHVPDDGVHHLRAAGGAERGRHGLRRGADGDLPVDRARDGADGAAGQLSRSPSRRRWATTSSSPTPSSSA